ncbi:extracellular solute-binding protein [Paenibacillus chartarius]|uniref:Extracellular solute-binding protein n=1 Tax=Paenibacillus chartarius TaxID=747481 RepID=A0ABV6DHF1_9BACL
MKPEPWEKALKTDVPYASRRAEAAARSVMQHIKAGSRSHPAPSRWYAAAAALGAAIWAGSYADWTSAGKLFGILQPQPAAESVDMNVTLKLSIGDERLYRDMFGDQLKKRFPSLKIEFSDISTYEKGNYSFDAFEQMTEEQKPDLIISSSAIQYRLLAEHGKLLPLDGLEQPDKIAAVVNALRMPDGKSYGIATEFDGRAIFYNKKLFDQYKVPYPTDRMTWKQVMELAKRFPAEGNPGKKIFGFHEMYIPMFPASYLVGMIAHTHGLSYVDDSRKKAAMDSTAWNEALHLALDAYREGRVHPAKSYTIQNNRIEQADQQAMDLFAQGRAAMALDTIGAISRLKGSGIDYGIVTAPVDPSNPDINTQLIPGSILSVNPNSPNLRQAMEVLRYISQDDTDPRAYQNGVTSNMLPIPVHESTLLTIYGDRLKPFYAQQEPDWRRTVYSYDPTMDIQISKSISSIVDEETDAAAAGKQSVEEAQRSMQTRIQAVLDAPQ